VITDIFEEARALVDQVRDFCADVLEQYRHHRTRKQALIAVAIALTSSAVTIGFGWPIALTGATLAYGTAIAVMVRYFKAPRVALLLATVWALAALVDLVVPRPKREDQTQ
jgi:hypothetical protein